MKQVTWEKTTVNVIVVRKVTTHLRLGSRFNNNTGREKGEPRRSLL